MEAPRIFLISPANASGKRAALLRRPEANFELAARLRIGRATLGEVFSFVSGLYFRGKLTYARRFARPPTSLPGAFVITSGRGLASPDMLMSLADLDRFARIAIDLSDARYRVPLTADAHELSNMLAASDRVVLLGSIATPKYVELLLEAFGERLCFPEAFVGIGDMQRGAMLLKAAEAGVELPYVPAIGAVRRLTSRTRGV